MRRRNWRVVITGFVLIILAAGFFFFMTSVGTSSSDPVEMMRTVGSVSGTLVGISVAMIIFGLIGKKV